MGSDLKGVSGVPGVRSDSAFKLVSFYVPRGEVRRPFYICTRQTSNSSQINFIGHRRHDFKELFRNGVIRGLSEL